MLHYPKHPEHLGSKISQHDKNFKYNTFEKNQPHQLTISVNYNKTEN